MITPYPTVCPEALFDIANRFAMVIGEGPAEALTWRSAPFEKDGTRYATYNLLLSPGAFAIASQPLVRPEWDTEEVIDMDKATLCQSRVDFVDVAALEEGDPFPQPNPERILVLLNCGDIDRAVKEWGLELLLVEDEPL
jgi:hypothetical protein